MTASPAGAARIPVVDDDRDLRRVVTSALADEGYDVRVAPDGRAALGLVRTWQPRVIVLDLMMPALDGWDFRARQLATPGGEEVPVVFLSAARDVRVEALRPAAIVPKPFDLELLLDTVAGLAR